MNGNKLIILTSSGSETIKQRRYIRNEGALLDKITNLLSKCACYLLSAAVHTAVRKCVSDFKMCSTSLSLHSFTVAAVKKQNKKTSSNHHWLPDDVMQSQDFIRRTEAMDVMSLKTKNDDLLWT